MALQTIVPLGDRAFLMTFSSEPAAATWAGTVRDARWPGVTEVVLAYRSVALFFDPDLVDPSELESRLSNVVPRATTQSDGRLVVIPVLYDGPDLSDIATRLRLTEREIIDEHSRHEYHIFAIGFLPGFPYAGYLPASLAGIPRRSTPRARVAAGSVAIAGAQTGIYPIESPGGWHLLGRTPICVADPETGYFPLKAGDRLRFDPITLGQFESLRDERLC
jgi:KipI family sensor histidine kinase inhibitor